MSEKNNSSGGIGFLGILQIVFIVLKLTGNIAWNWWWVLSPIWISVLIVCIILLVYAIILVIEEQHNRQ